MSEPRAWDSARVCVRVTGKDRFAWANGVLTSDVKALEGKTGPRAQLACALDQKGKIQADVVVFVDDAAEGTSLHLWLPRSRAADVVAAWDRYIVMEDVELSVDEALRLFHVEGASPLRAAPFDALGEGGFVVEGDPGLPEVPAAEVEARRIAAGRAAFGVDFDDKNYVHEAGLDQRAVSFTKGCYLGQEVVCMLQMRGHVNKRLVQLAVPAGVAPGAEVTVDGQAVGAVTSVAGDVALAMVKYAHSEPGKSLAVGGAPATVRALAR